MESTLHRGYEHLENGGVAEGSDHPSNPNVNGKLGTIKDDDSDDDVYCKFSI